MLEIPGPQDHMSIDERVLATIHTLYQAAEDESRWANRAPRHLPNIPGASGPLFGLSTAPDKPRLPTFISVNFDPKFMEAYLSDMVPFDPTNVYLMRHPQGTHRSRCDGD